MKKPICHRAILPRWGFFVLAVALGVLGAKASTIIGNIRNTSGNAYATNALFTPLSTPQADAGTIIASTPTNVIAATDGSFSVVLKQGNYKVNLGNVPNDTFIISVPNDSATYNLTALISSQLTYNYPVSPTYEQLVNKGVANGYASLNSSARVPIAQLGSGAASGYILTTDGSVASWQAPSVSFAFDTSQFSVSGSDVVIKKSAALTNLILFNSGLGPALGLAAGAGITFSNGSLTLKSNSLLTVGDGTGTAQLRFQSGSFASDQTGSEQWNFKTAAGGGRDANTAARIIDLTNGLAFATQDGLGTNGTFYATISTNIPLSVVGTAAHLTNLFELRNSSGAIVGLVSSNGLYRSQYDFFAQLTTTDNTTNNIYTFTPPAGTSARVVVQVVGWNSTSSAAYGKIGTFKNVSGTVTQVGGTATLGSAEDDAAYESILDTSANVIRVRVAGNTGKTVNWAAYGTIYYAP